MYRYKFDAKLERQRLVSWVREWFQENGPKCNAVIGISGGKDSTVAAAVCVEALGKDRVIGILMPNGEQSDIVDSQKVVEKLGIKSYTINIGDIVKAERKAIHEGAPSLLVTEQTMCNLPARIRMTTLYAMAQSNNGRVVNTCNLSENVCGFSTLYGDHAGDFSLFDQFTATEVVKIGLTYKELPRKLVKKTPCDGLCGKTDEEAYGFSYADLDKLIRTGQGTKELIKAVCERYQRSMFKTLLVNFPHYSSPDLYDYIPMVLSISLADDVLF